MLRRVYTMNEYLNDALGEISDEKIAEAANGKKTKRVTFLKVASVACIVLAVAAAVVFMKADKPKIKDEQTQNQANLVVQTAADTANDETTLTAADTANDETTLTAADTANDETTLTAAAEICPEKKWDEKESNEKYTELSFNGKTYLSTGMKAGKTEIGTKLGPAKAKGFDSYTDKIYETDCEVYTVGTFKSDFLVAVKFDTDGNTYSYKAEDWFPSDLKDFTDKLNFSENIKIDSDIILSSNSDVSASQIKLHENEALPNTVYRLLEACGKAKALEYTSDNMAKDGERILEFGVSSPLLSRYSLFLTISEDGYIMTNLVDVGVSFFVGKEAVKALFETADKTGGVKYVPTTALPNPSDVYMVDSIEVTEVYSEPSKEE